MTPAQQKALLSFRRSAYAAPLREVLGAALREARVQHETQIASENNRGLVLAYSRVISELFGGEA